MKIKNNVIFFARNSSWLISPVLHEPVSAVRGFASSCFSGPWPPFLHSLSSYRMSNTLISFGFYKAFSYSFSSQSLSSILFHPYPWDLCLVKSPKSFFSVPYCSLSKKVSLLTLPFTFPQNTVFIYAFSFKNPSLGQTKYCTLSDSLCCTTDSDKLCQVIIDNTTSDWRLEKALSQTGVVLTTEIVDNVLQRFRYEEKLAFRFFTWAGRQECYSHQPQAYSNMIDILSCTRYKAKQFGVVCEILDYMKRRTKTSIPMDAVLTILRKYTETHLTEVSKVTKKKRIRVKKQPEINAFNLLLESLCKCSLVEEAEAMFYKVKNKVIPDGNTYNILFFGWCRVRIPGKALKVLEKMVEMGHTPDNFTYNAAMDSFCKTGMVSEALDLFQFMKNKGSTMSSPTAKTYCIMIVALAKCDRMEECFKLLSEMRTSGCVPDVSTYKELIEGMFLAGKVDEAYRFLEEMGSNGYPPDIVTYNCFLKVLCDLKEANEAMRLFHRMVEVGCEPSVHTYNMLISMFFTMGIPDGAFDAWHEMDKRGCARDVDTYCVMIEGLFGSSKVEDACLLLEDVVNQEIKLPYQRFDSFLMHLSELGNLRAIHTLSEYMRKFYNTAMARRFAVSQKRKSMSLRRK
ncbi:pentatricopeptide repeat-containing protein At1g73400, mitochondrial [Aristolochia californica]|uniref:pentatricopeptide repeat-containing protein At1g73400, mitochondrial n=1 Tax=Aristolochia californica TaxID=171875 RepID=UPI0035DFA7AE